MALTQSIDALRPELWQKELYKDRMDNLFFVNKNMMGTDENNIVQIKTDLAKGRGDTITFPFTAKITADPIIGDAELEGNEKAVSSYSQSVSINLANFPIRTSGLLDEQKVTYDMRKDNKDKAVMWQTEFIERQIMMKLGGIQTTTLTDVSGTIYSGQATFSNTSTKIPAADEAAGTGNRYLCADASGLDSLLATDVATLSLATKAKVKARLANPRIEPLRVDGQNIYVWLIHPWQAADLKNATSGINWNQIQRDAQVRGDKNPIFTGAIGYYDGVLIHEHEYVPTGLGNGSLTFATGGTAIPSGVRAFRSLFCGRQAVCFAETSKSNQMTEELFNYKQQLGVNVNFMGGIQKTMFNSLEYGVIAIDTGATDLS